MSFVVWNKQETDYLLSARIFLLMFLSYSKFSYFVFNDLRATMSGKFGGFSQEDINKISTSSKINKENGK